MTALPHLVARPLHVAVAVALALIGLLAGPVAAEEAVEIREPADPLVSITFSPAHLALPMFEVTGELRLAPKVGVAAILGGGSFSGDRVGIPLDTNRYTAFEAGGQFRYYALGSFRSGLELGAEVMYLTVSTDVGTATGEGLSVGGFGGAKHTFGFGLTLEGQVGAQLLAARAEADNGAMNDGSDVALLLNLNAGWSF